MKIIEPSAELLSPCDMTEGIALLSLIERMARISHRSEHLQTEVSWRRFIIAVVMEHGDWSVVEHAAARVLFRVDRGITHELVRHRLFSVTQESTRFCNGNKTYPDHLEFIKPQDLSEGSDAWNQWRDALAKSEWTYRQMLYQGCAPQTARSVLPNALASTIALTGNLRTWRGFFLARTTKESHPDMRRITIPLLEEFQKRIPIIYDDIIPNSRQIDNAKKAR